MKSHIVLCFFNGKQLNRVNKFKYLGLVFLSDQNFSCSLQINKQKLFRAANTEFYVKFGVIIKLYRGYVIIICLI